VSAGIHKPDWARLFHIACDLVRQVNSHSPIIDRWTFGGGTALMLQIDHRESHDVDFFLEDPQCLSFLDPQKRDFKFAIRPSGYDSDGTGFMKLGFDGLGEIDFIVAQAKTNNPAIARDIEGETVLLETIPEIIAKKIVFRGASIKPRDLFDIAAASETHGDQIISALREYPPEVSATLRTLDQLNPEFVNNAISQLLMRPKFRALATTAMEQAKEILRSV